MKAVFSRAPSLPSRGARADETGRGKTKPPAPGRVSRPREAIVIRRDPWYTLGAPEVDGPLSTAHSKAREEEIR